jgi:predicted DNA-binding transcriptional regulator AlpA
MRQAEAGEVRLIRGAATLAAMLGVSETFLWREERAGRFPQRLRLAAGTVAWTEREIAEWIASRPRGPKPSPVLSEQAREGQRKRHEARS